jgi:Uma2 family endonuclease
MKPRASSQTASRRTRIAPPDPFRFGWRYVNKPGANGTSKSVRVPLTPEDLLHPQWGDVIPEHTYQERGRGYLSTVLNYRATDQPHRLILSDCLVNWGVKGLRNHSPDISVFDDVADRDRGRKSLSVRRERARPVLVIEIVSLDPYDRRPRDNDVVIKVKEYYRAGVPLYVIIDQEEEDGPRRLLGYQRGPRKYEAMSQDERGRLLLEPVGLLLGLREDDRPVCFDAATGKEMVDYVEMAQARDAEAKARRAAEVQAAEQRARAQTAEESREMEAQARRAAEAALAAAQVRLQELEAQSRRGGKKGPRR